MRQFFLKLFWFTVPILIFSLLGLFVPPTPRASKSLLFAYLAKDYLLENTPSPRIIFVGGSNLSFGLNSQMIKDSLQRNPINTGVHAAIGTRYMLENTAQYVREGDIVVLALEYQHFYRAYNYSSGELLRTIFDVNPSSIGMLNLPQAINLMRFVPKFSASKFNPMEYIDVAESDIYSVNSFNQYGDAVAHWGREPEDFLPYDAIEGQINPVVMEQIKKFEQEIQMKNATLLVTYPGYQDISYSNGIEQIEQVVEAFEDYGLTILGEPERYKIPNEMMFNTAYHLNKKGVDYRTRLFIEDFRAFQLRHQVPK